MQETVTKTVVTGAYHDKTDPAGLVMADHYLFGSVVATILVIVVTAQIALDTSYWTVFNHITIWGSLVFYFCLTFFFNWAFLGSHVGSLTTAMADPTFWFTSLLATVVLLLSPENPLRKIDLPGASWLCPGTSM